jgi:hypothetical protein
MDLRMARTRCGCARVLGDCRSSRAIVLARSLTVGARFFALASCVVALIVKFMTDFSR